MNRLIEIYGAGDVVRLDESSLPLQIGNHDTAHIRLDGEFGVAAYIGEDRNYLFLQPAENNTAVYHNDERVLRSVWLKSNDTTRIGTTLIYWQLSGQRLEVHVSTVEAIKLKPPSERPDPPAAGDIEADNPPLIPSGPQPTGRHKRPLFIGLFILLLVAAAFVLLAKPLAITVTPAPDTIDIAGFPPVMKYGDRYLGIVGSYRLLVEKQGYRPLTREIEISGSNGNYTFTLEKLPGLIDLGSEPPGARVLIDGTSLGTTPLQGAEISAGLRTVRFEHDRYLPAERTVEIEGFGKQSSLNVTLEPAWAKYSLQTDPEGADVSVDGEEKGTTPLELELIDGQRKIVFSKTEFVPLTIELDIVAGQDKTPPVFRMEAAPATLAIRSEPAGATVTIDGIYRGQTPTELSLQAKTAHEIGFSAAGYKGAKRSLTLAPAEKRELVISLEAEYGTVFIMATPAEATLTIDGKTEKSANGRFSLTTRPHTITLQADGYTTKSKTITPKVGYSQKLELVLVRKGQPAETAPVATVPMATTGLGQKLILIEPRPFQMGAARNEPGRRANENEHEVHLKQKFYISEREVTNAEFLRFRSQHTSGVSGNRSLEIASHPVVNVTWEEAAQFMNWLSQKDGLPPYYVESNGTMLATEAKGLGYRLPTEAEWAYVARVAGRKEVARYPWAGKFPPKAKVGNFADEAARHLLPTVIDGYNDGFAASAPTGSFPANPVGVFDLGGNVAEWCHDYYAANASTVAVDPMGPASGGHHVVRGSSWRDASITELRFSYRRYSREPANDIGFRIARYAK